MATERNTLNNFVTDLVVSNFFSRSLVFLILVKFKIFSFALFDYLNLLVKLTAKFMLSVMITQMK